MINFEDECVGCSDMGLQCKGSSCPNHSVKRLYCDKCGDEVHKLYIHDGEQLCRECLLGLFEVVEEDSE